LRGMKESEIVGRGLTGSKDMSWFLTGMASLVVTPKVTAVIECPYCRAQSYTESPTQTEWLSRKSAPWVAHQIWDIGPSRED